MKIASVFLLASILLFSIELRVGYYDNFPLCYEESGEAKGFYVDILNYIAEKEKWKIEYVYREWTELLKMLEDGEIDALVAIAYTEDRARLFVFNHKPFLMNWGVMIAKHRIEGISDLSGKTVALVSKDVYAEEFLELVDEFGIDVDIVEFSTYLEVTRAIEDGIADAGVVSRVFALLHSSKFSYVTTPIVFRPVKLMMAFRKRIDPDVISTIDGYLKKLKLEKNSVYWRLLDEYVSSGMPKIELKYYLGLVYVLIIAFSAAFVWFELSIGKKARELKAANENLRSANEELLKVTEELRTLKRRFDDLVGILSDMGELGESEEDFARKVLELALRLVPKAKYGSVSVFEEDRWKFLAAVGHDIDVLKRLDLKKEYSVAWGIDRTTVIDRIQDQNVLLMPRDIAEKLVKAARPVKSTILAPLVVDGEVKGYLSLDMPDWSDEKFTKDDVEVVDKFAKVMTAFYMVRKYTETERKLVENVVLALVKTMEKNDPYTVGHSEKVRDLAVELAKEYGLSGKRLRNLSLAALVHDIGKIFIPQRILNKPGKLTREEYELVKTHSVRAYEVLSEIEGMEHVAVVVLHHHERWDGQGYPSGLKGLEIPLESRIIAVADAFDAMVSLRSYRDPLPPERALEELLKNAGTQFDPALVDVFVKIMKRKLGEEAV